MKTLKAILLTGRRVILRVDINVPIANDQITDDTRIREVIPTVQYILNQNPEQLTILAHQGRKKVRSLESSLILHSKVLEQLLGQPVTKVSVWTGRPDQGSKILLLENVRLSDEDSPEVEKRAAFAKQLSSHGDVYINDAFSVCHRDHASVSQLPKLMSERAMGLLLEKEINTLQSLLNSPDRPLTMVLGGAKLETKLPLIRNFVDKADYFLLGGGIANTFLAANGLNIGQSLHQSDMIPLAKELLASHREKFILPTDAIIERGVQSYYADCSNGVGDGDRILDIGEKTVNMLQHFINESSTIVWNGPFGYFENDQFKAGSLAVATMLSQCPARVIIGGGDTIAVLNKAGLSFDHFHHVSTGGGAMLEYLSGAEMPGLTALE